MQESFVFYNNNFVGARYNPVDGTSPERTDVFTFIAGFNNLHNYNYICYIWANDSRFGNSYDDYGIPSVNYTGNQMTLSVTGSTTRYQGTVTIVADKAGWYKHFGSTSYYNEGTVIYNGTANNLNGCVMYLGK